MTSLSFIVKNPEGEERAAFSNYFDAADWCAEFGFDAGRWRIEGPDGFKVQYPIAEWNCRRDLDA